MNRTRTLTTLGCIALLALALVPIMTGAASDTMLNQTVAVDEDTEAIRVLAENVTNDTASVTIYNDTETEVANGTLNTTSSTADTFEYRMLDPANNSEYRVSVTGDGADLLEVSTVQVVAAGGGPSGQVDPHREALVAAGVVGIVLLNGAYRVVAR